ncbi:protein kinase [Candidatus Uabimicrobium sp. HlEnr_7]|uniref:protein kinase domain-containing protein n=1 Tax=Candidatus Uabimicrobium helgolandensis TaxID=3095367 RepID=UPI00355802C5
MITQYEKNILQFLINKNILTQVQVTEIVKNIYSLRQSRNSVDILAFLQQYNYISADVAYKLREMIVKSSQQSQSSQRNQDQTMAGSPTGIFLQQNRNQAPAGNIVQQNQDQTMMGSPAGNIAQQNQDQTMMGSPAGNIAQQNQDQTMMGSPTGNIAQQNQDQTMMGSPTGNIAQQNQDQTMMGSPTGAFPQQQNQSQDQTMMGSQAGNIAQQNQDQTMMGSQAGNIAQQNQDQTMMGSPTGAFPQQNQDQTMMGSQAENIAQQNQDQTMIGSPARNIPQPNQNQTMAGSIAESVSPQIQEPITNVQQETNNGGKSLNQSTDFVNGQDKMFGHYRIERELGRGGMGLVLLVYDTKLDRQVALKVIINNQNISDEQIRRFALEARATAKLKHPNIVEVYETGSTPKNYFTMEYVKGKPLSSLIQKGSLKTKDIALIMKKSSDAISHAYKEHKIIHRDIKPSNIMMDDKEPKIMDFGLAKEMDRDEQLSQDGGMMGTLGYMPPEQIDNDNVGHHSDVYALGATLYNALTGRPPFQGESYYMVLRQIHNDDPMPPSQLTPGIPKELEAICLKCLQKKPRNRYRNAKGLADDLDNFLNNRPVNAKPPSLVAKGWKWTKRNKTKASIFTTIFVFLVAITILMTINNAMLTEERDNAKLARDNAEEAQEDAVIQLTSAIISGHRSLNTQYKLTIFSGQNSAEKNNVEITRQYLKSFKIQEQEYQDDLRDTINGKNYEGVLEKLNPQSYLYQKLKEKQTDLISHNWEWQWLKTIVNRPFQKYKHDNIIMSCVHDQNNSEIICGDDDGNILSMSLPLSPNSRFRVWKNKEYGDKRPVIKLVISPNSKFLLSLSNDRQLTLWDLPNKRVIRKYWRTLRNVETNEKDLIDISDFVFTKDSKYFIAGYGEKDANYRMDVFGKMNRDLVPRFANAVLWSVTDSKARHEFFLYMNKKRGDGIAHAVTSVDISPNNKLLAVGRANTITPIIVINLKSKKEKVLKEHTQVVKHVKFSSDGRYLISIDKKGIILFWDIRTWKLHRSISSESRINRCLVVDKMLITFGSGGQVTLWDLTNLDDENIQISSFSCNEEMIGDIAYDSTNKQIILESRRKYIKAINFSSVVNPSRLSGKSYRYVQFHPKHNDIVVSVFGPRTFSLEETSKPYTNCKLIEVLDTKFNKQGTRIALASKVQKTVSIIDFTDRETLFEGIKSVQGLTANKDILGIKFYDKPQSLAFNPVSPQILVGFSYHGTQVKPTIFDYRGSKVKPPKNKKYALRESLYLYDILKNKMSKMWVAYFEKKVERLDISDNGKQMLALCNRKLYTKTFDSVQKDIDKNKKFFNKEALTQLDFNEYEDPEDNKYLLKNEHRLGIRSIYHACFSPNNKYIAVARSGISNNLLILDAKSLKKIATLEDHTNSVSCCDFSPDGKRLVSSSGDGTVRIWNIERIKNGDVRHSLLTLRGHKGSVNYCAFSHDGKNIASCGSELLIWRTE